jgi:glutamate racemase
VVQAHLPIGVFDSGVGGLTVVRALREELPREDILYLGDTARVPYGTRSPETVQKYAKRVAGHLLRRGIKALVVGCNTATTYALEDLITVGQAHGIPVVGVIEPGVSAALLKTRGHIGVIGTEGTIRGGAYRSQLIAQRANLQITSTACPLFVALAEEGWTDGEIAEAVALRYLKGLRNGPDTLILGCTHYPLLVDAIASALPGVQLVDSATSTAQAVSKTLQQRDLLRSTGTGHTRFLVTDNRERFVDVGTRFLGHPPEPTEVVDIEDGDQAAWDNEVPS